MSSWEAATISEKATTSSWKAAENLEKAATSTMAQEYQGIVLTRGLEVVGLPLDWRTASVADEARKDLTQSSLLENSVGIDKVEKVNGAFYIR